MEFISLICADDDKYFRILYRKIFSRRGYAIRVFSDGQEVIDAYRAEPSDILILDIDMPIKTGLEVCRMLRQDPEGYNVPIIIVSSYDTEEAIVNALSAGADDYIIKPFKFAELLAKTVAVLRKRSLAASREMGLPVGSLFAGKYEILDKIGSGGFSNVFHAIMKTAHESTEVALKVFELTATLRNDKEFMKLFLREAYGLSKLDHPNIIRLHDFGSSSNYYFLAMEYFEGKTLYQIMTKTGQFPETEAAMIGYETIKALAYLKSHKVVHRDIKPNNIMIVDSGDVKLIDFGMARQIKEETVSIKGLFTGTPQYAAPESIQMRSDIDSRADVFSLGATMYYLVTQEEPFSAATPQEVFNERFRKNTEATPIKEIEPGLSDAFAGLVDKMLALNREDRPSVEEVSESLRNIVCA